MSRPPESVLIQKHYVELLREAAVYNERQAFTALQFHLDPNERFAYAEDLELWKSVQILIAQRDKLQKYVRLLINAEGADHDTTALAAKEYLEQIGIET